MFKCAYQTKLTNQSVLFEMVLSIAIPCGLEGEGSMFLQNVAIYLKVHMALQPRIPESTSSQP
jgi:hypothetical protein